ncbi:hypothetical protein MIMGU_mgv1a016164mg [Erythranthe guttata]|uniref:Uncharacterized protein n=1 Tax=Erythranthe guttata TaxID=4155 RepID=A0A022RZH6_ERYGU|nr:hypothetical protein MIMGU_mgv1a016164mg [Erythranthe guttata]
MQIKIQPKFQNVRVNLFATSNRLRIRTSLEHKGKCMFPRCDATPTHFNIKKQTGERIQRTSLCSNYSVPHEHIGHVEAERAQKLSKRLAAKVSPMRSVMIIWAWICLSCFIDLHLSAIKDRGACSDGGGHGV